MIAGGAASGVGGSRRDGIALASKLNQFDWFRREAIVDARSSGTAMMNGYRSSRCGIGRAAAIAAKLDFRSREIRSASAFAIVRLCRKDTGSSFNFFAVWSSKNVTIVGDTESWIHSTDHRHFCATCGSSLYSIVDGTNEVEIRAGAFDNAPSGLLPTYELWLNRREGWLRPIGGAEQHTGNRS